MLWIKRHGLLIIWFVGVTTGTLLANISGTKYVHNYEFMFVSDSDNQALMIIKDILFDRLRDYVILFIIMMTSIGKNVFSIVLMYIGMSVGTIVSFLTMKYSIFGIIVYCLSLCPQYIFYGIALYMINMKKEKLYNSKLNFEIIKIFCVMCLLVILGVITEAYVNPCVMKIL